METGLRSFSSMNIQNRELSQPVRPIITSELIECSGFISTLQVFLNIESFFKKVCETSPPASKLSGKIKKMLLNFKSDNFTSISTIVPSNFSVQEEKPSNILCRVLEDYRTCSEIPAEKRPDSLFSPELTTRVLFSQLISNRFSDVMDLLQFKSSPNIIAIDVVYDIPPTSERVLNLLGNLNSYKNYETSGFISAHGFFYSAFVKTLEQWRSFSDGKLYNWANLVWNFCTSCSYPVLIVLVNGSKSSNFLSKIDLDTMQKFCKLQDSRVKISYTEEFAENLGKKNLRKDEELFKEHTSEYLRKDVRKNEERVNEGEEKKPYRIDIGKGRKNDTEKKEDGHEYIKNIQDYQVRDFGNRPRNYSTEPYSQSRVLKEEPYSQSRVLKEEPYSQSRVLKEEPYSQSRVLKEDTQSRVLKEDPQSKVLKQELSYKPYANESIEFGRFKEDSQYKFYRSDYADQSRYKEDNPYKQTKKEPNETSFNPRPGLENSYKKNDSTETEKPSKSGILKHSSIDSKYRLQTSNLYSPKDLSNTARESDRFEEENTEKPYSILKNSWLEKKEPSEKKVNFSNVVFEIDDSVKGQMPEIKLASGRYRSPEYKSSYPEIQRTPALKQPESLTVAKLKENDKDSWLCPKCNKGISSSSYECGSCRFINWDKFYSLKSKSSKVRAESIPTRSPEPDFSKTYRPTYETRIGESWRGERIYDKYSENIGRLTSRDFNYNR